MRTPQVRTLLASVFAQSKAISIVFEVLFLLASVSQIFSLISVRNFGQLDYLVSCSLIHLELRLHLEFLKKKKAVRRIEIGKLHFYIMYVSVTFFLSLSLTHRHIHKIHFIY